MRRLWLLLFCCTVFTSVSAESLEENVRRVVGRRSPTLAMVLQIEEPTPYQQQQIEALVNKAYLAAQKKQFKSLDELALFINNQFPQDGEDTPLLKGAFSEAPDQAPQGTLDCDSRALLVVAVWEMLGKPLGNLQLVQMTTDFLSHVVLSTGDSWLDLTTGKPFDRQQPLAQPAYVQLLDTPTKLQSLSYANRAAASLISRRKASQADTFSQKSLSLWPDNLVSLQNMRSDKPSNYLRVVHVRAANYLASKGQRVSIPLTHNQLVQAAAENSAVTMALLNEIDKLSAAGNEVLLQGSDKEYNWQSQELKIEANKILIEADRNPFGLMSIRLGKVFFDLDRFDEMIQQANQADRMLPTRLYPDPNHPGEYIKIPEVNKRGETWDDFKDEVERERFELVNMIMAARIIRGEQKPIREELEKKQWSYEILSCVLDGYCPMKLIKPAEKLRTWKGCRSFREALEINEDDNPWCY